MNEPLLSPMGAELLEWALDQPVRFWVDLVLQAVGGATAAWKVKTWGWRFPRWVVLTALVMPTLAAWRWLRPPEDPLLVEMLAALDNPEAVFDPRDGTLLTPPLVCGTRLVGDTSPREITYAHLAGTQVTASMLGAKGWWRLQTRVREVAQRLRDQQLVEEATAREREVAAARLLALEAARNARAASTPQQSQGCFSAPDLLT